MNACARFALWGLLALIAIRPSLDALTGWAAGGVWKANPAAAAGLMLLAAGALWLACLDADRRKAVLTNPLLLILAVWWALVGLWGLVPFFYNTPWGSEGLRDWLRLATLLPCAALGEYLSQQGRQSVIAKTILASAAIPAIAGIWQIAAQSGASIQGFHRIHSTFVHPNPFSFFLVVAFASAYWQWRQAFLWRWAIAMAACVALLIATFSLTGLGMFCVMLAVIAMFESRATRRGVAALAILFIIALLATDTGRSRLAGLTQWDNLDEIERTQRETGSHTWRLLNWRFLYREWVKQPYFGYGLASVPHINPNRNQLMGGIGHDPHNDYMLMLVETGMAGFALWLGLLFTTGRLLYRKTRPANAPPARSMAIVGLALFAAWAAGSLNDNLISATAFQWPLWLWLGAASASSESDSCAS